MLEWDEFLRCCKELEAVSTTLDDGWHYVVAKEGEPGFTYLEKKCTRSHRSSPGHISSWSGEVATPGLQAGEEWVEGTEEGPADRGCAETGSGAEILHCVYHVLYSSSYRVPVLYFNVWRQNGSLLPLSDIWSLMPDCLQEQLLQLRWTTVTQQEHPIQGTPYFQLHPCKTAHFMEQTLPKDTKHANYLVTWLSTIAPVVGLEMPIQYSAIAGLAATGRDINRT